MTRIESDVQSVVATPSEVYEFLCDLRNYGQLMPSVVSNFTSNEKEADFEISGLGKIHVEITKTIPGEKVELTPSGKLPFQFDLAWEISDKNGKANVTAVANADLNIFMKMMAEPQLNKFVQAQAETLKTYFENLKS